MNPTSPWVEVPHIDPPYSPFYVEASKQLLAQTLSMFDPNARMLAVLAMGRFPDVSERVEVLAQTLDVDPVDLFLGNLSYDLVTTQACSTLALSTEVGPVLARNMDWFPEHELARASCILATDYGLQAGFVGLVGVITGLSQRGFAVALNAVSGVPDLDGMPMLLFLRQLLDTAADFDEAVHLAESTRLASAGIITLVGLRNEDRVSVERTPRRYSTRRPVGATEPLLTTNHFCELEDPWDECPRYARLVALAPGLSTNPEDAELLTVLTDPAVIQSITAQQIIARPAAGQLRMYVPRRLLA